VIEILNNRPAIFLQKVNIIDEPKIAENVENHENPRFFVQVTNNNDILNL